MSCVLSIKIALYKPSRSVRSQGANLLYVLSLRIHGLKGLNSLLPELKT